MEALLNEIMESHQKIENYSAESWSKLSLGLTIHSLKNMTKEIIAQSNLHIEQWCKMTILDETTK